MWPFLTACLALCFLAAPARADAPILPPGFEIGDSAVVAAVIDGDSLSLADGRTVRLVGIQAPKRPEDRAGFPELPIAREARAALEGLVAGRTVALNFSGARSDRYGRVLAQVAAADGAWIQGALILAGMARVHTFADNRLGAAAMYALERDAREARRGLWADALYQVRTPDEAAAHIGRFEIVQGKILDGARTDRGVVLNLGKDWRTAFALLVDTDARKLFRADRVDPLSLRGIEVRVRGFIRRDRERAVIDVTHPEQIERL